MADLKAANGGGENSPAGDDGAGTTSVGAAGLLVVNTEVEGGNHAMGRESAPPQKKHGRKQGKSKGVEKKQRSCRICMDSVSQEDFLSKKAFKLGCKCSDGLDVCHTYCARKWFKIRKCTKCEICDSEAAGLPESVKREVKEVARRSLQESAAGGTSRFPIHMRMGHRSQSEELHLCTYTTFCLLPAALSAIFMVFFYFEVLKLKVVQTMMLAITVSSLTMVHWVVEPNKPVWHMVFVLMFIMSIMGLSSMFISVHRFGSLAACISGAIVGALLSVGAYTAVRATANLTVNPFSDSSSHSDGSSPRGGNAQDSLV